MVSVRLCYHQLRVKSHVLMWVWALHVSARESVCACVCTDVTSTGTWKCRDSVLKYLGPPRLRGDTLTHIRRHYRTLLHTATCHSALCTHTRTHTHTHTHTHTDQQAATHMEAGSRKHSWWVGRPSGGAAIVVWRSKERGGWMREGGRARHRIPFAHLTYLDENLTHPD